jgi:hypothetical protein
MQSRHHDHDLVRKWYKRSVCGDLNYSVRLEPLRAGERTWNYDVDESISTHLGSHF